MKTPTLFTPVKLGAIDAPNRLVMAPLTRMRACPVRVPTPLMAKYYSQRATAGLIVTEATVVSQQGTGCPNTPGIYTDDQVAGWHRVTDAVHRAGGRIVLQLWHMGRISDPSFQPGGGLPVAPSAIAPRSGQILTETGLRPYVTPRALETAELPGIVSQFAAAAQRAKIAGFDGVEIHNANGYLLDQFLRDGTNHRTDEYGGPAANRARLTLEVTQAVTRVWGSDRVGIRFSPRRRLQRHAGFGPIGNVRLYLARVGSLPACLCTPHRDLGRRLAARSSAGVSGGSSAGVPSAIDCEWRGT